MIKPIKKYIYLFLLLLLISPTIAAEEKNSEIIASALSHVPERRKEQFQTSPGYALFPFPYSLPGIGKGLSLVGATMNIASTHTDAYALILGGEVEGLALGVGDIHLIPRRLIVELGYSSLSKALIQSYSERGMNSNKDDYRLLELTETEYFGGRMTATFFERRFEIYGAWYEGAAELGSIRDKDGNIIVETQNASRESSQTTIIGTRIDLTDDYADPRQGVRFDISRFSTPPSDLGPDFYVMDYNITAYLPLGERSTWAFNYLRSDSVVSRKGETDPSKLQAQQGVNCADASLTTTAQQYCIAVINQIIQQNTHGTATTLGGFSHLRSYPQGRYSGAHTEFYGSEIRWNLTDEATPFDIFVMKDVRTAVQLAAFYEVGSTAERRRDLGGTWRKSYGLGLRMVTASGVVFRADLAYGHEGFAPEIFIGYPWEI